MSASAPQWEYITTRKDARVLQTFTCTTDLPLTEGGRKMPHPRPWEWQTQAHLRRSSQLLRAGDSLLIGRDESGEIVCAAYLSFDQSAEVLQVFIAAIAIQRSQRGQHGLLADHVISEICAEGTRRATSLGLATVVLAGKVHVQNRASQYLVERTGFEPQENPGDTHQLWVLALKRQVA
mgnify:FL=1